MKESIAAFIKVLVLFSITILTVFMVLTLSSCSNVESEDVATDPVFVCVSDNGSWRGERRIRVMVDRKTDLVYIVYGDEKGQSISPLYRTPTEVYTYEQWKEDYLEVKTNGNVD